MKKEVIKVLARGKLLLSNDLFENQGFVSSFGSNRWYQKHTQGSQSQSQSRSHDFEKSMALYRENK